MGRETNSEREVVVITGASAGLGRAIAQEFARHGAKVGLVARNAERLKDVKREVEELGGEAVVCIGDVADFATHERLAQQTETAFGPIDVWVNNAMVSVFAESWKVKPEEYRRVMEVNYLGYVYGTQVALKRMRERNRGAIVQVGSALAYRAIPLQSAYCASKHATRGFTDSVRTELLRESRSIHITMVHMPALNTPQFDWVRSRLPKRPQPVPPIFQPEVGARAVYWAAHHRRRELFVGGSTMLTIWLNKLMPWAGDWYLARKGFESQMTQKLEDPQRADNTFDTVRGQEFGAHGRFDEKAKSHSIRY